MSGFDTFLIVLLLLLILNYMSVSLIFRKNNLEKFVLQTEAAVIRAILTLENLENLEPRWVNLTRKNSHQNQI